jgi:alpha-tubulin suppressor-like RCC1 family protein
MNAISITFPRRWPWCAALLLVAVACKGSETTAAPTTGSIQVTAATTGADLDPDGYIVTLQTLQGDTSTGTTSSTQPVAVNGTVTFSDVKPGSYSLALGGASVNCPVVGDNPRAASVTAGGTVQLTFQVTCVQRVDVSGVWNFIEQYGSPFACNDTGSFTFTPTGDGFAGVSDQVGTCDRQDGSVDNSFNQLGPLSGSAVYASSGAVSVSFSLAGCSYVAAVAGTPPDHLINGAVGCPAGNGTWAAVRGGGAITSVTVSPSERSVVAGGAARLRAVMIDASGSRRVGPTVTWHSDAAAVATVDASGVVTGLAPGSATISATAETKSGTAAVSVEVVTFAAVQPGAYHSCGLTTSGAAYCWGHGAYGQIGEGAKASHLAPAAVAGGLNFAAVSVGAIHACGLTAVGAAYCWGLDSYGELGAGTPGAQICGSEGVPCSTTPLVVVGGRSFSALSAGWTQTCALDGAGAAYCWGDNTYGGLGNASVTGTRTPSAVTGGHAFVSIGVGDIFACGLTADSAAYCWGDNSFGQLGIGPGGGPEVCNGESCSTVPVLVTGGLTFVALSVGYWHACGLTADSTAYCWGNNGDGQLGVTTSESCSGFGAMLSCSTVPLPVAGVPQLVKLSAGSFHSCGVAVTGDGYCWGYNGNGELGNGTWDVSPTPTLIAGGLSFAAVNAYGAYHSCGLTVASVAYCWGYNGWGQVGDGTGLDTPQPVQVIGQAAAAGAAPLRVARVPRRAARGASLRPSLRLKAH